MQALAIAFTVLKYIILLMLYVGALGVVYGIITFVPPKGVWPEGEVSPPQINWKYNQSKTLYTSVPSCRLHDDGSRQDDMPVQTDQFVIKIESPFVWGTPTTMQDPAMHMQPVPFTQIESQYKT